MPEEIEPLGGREKERREANREPLEEPGEGVVEAFEARPRLGPWLGLDGALFIIAGAPRGSGAASIQGQLRGHGGGE